ncbi:MAG: YbgA family protein [Poseidonibacter sp.]|uniref:YbgA family protein n=1 Tax=Poseidonibacter sp. TaxID=2321188 RepID=UPI00359D834A
MKLGISSCLLGAMCRYNGGHSKDDFIINELSNYFEFVAYCPEKMVFSTPREAIRLVRVDNEVRVKTTNSKEDVTDTLTNISKELTEEIHDDELCGFVFKSKSPTCGMERVKIYPNGEGQSENSGVGIFANLIKEKYPLLPTEEEGRLSDPWLRENFLMQIFAYKDIFDFLKNEPSFKKLVEFHTSYKYLVYAKSHVFYKKLGNIVANHDKNDLEKVLADYKQCFLELLAQKGTLANTYNVLLHIFGYLKNLISKDEKAEILETIEEFKQEIVPLITVIKILNLYVRRFDIEYLQTQKFLNPYPKELALRSTTKAYK